MKAQGKIKDAPAERRDVVHGDQVYYQHPVHKMTHGEVTSVGVDGFRVKHASGEEHGVLWAGMLGHKLRKERKFTLVDRGEDGAVCHDEDGEQVFLRNGGDEPMKKSFEAQAQLIAPAAPAVDLQVLALELARSHMETATMLVSAMDRMTAAVLAQSQRIDQLIALQVAALNSVGGDHAQADSFHQGNQAAAG